MDLKKEIAELLQHPRRKGWGLRVQRLCEACWAILDDEAQSDDDLVNCFAQLLLEDDVLHLARMMIPDLRAPLDTAVQSKHKHRILEMTRKARATYAEHTSRSAPSFDDELYQAEKDIFLDAEIYRASILLHQSRTLDPASAEEIRAWLEKRPGARRQG